MTAENFTYWLQGFMEVQNPENLNKTQVQIIKDHLALVMTKVTPDRYNSEENNNVDEIGEEAGQYAEDSSLQPDIIPDCFPDTIC